VTGVVRYAAPVSTLAPVAMNFLLHARVDYTVYRRAHRHSAGSADDTDSTQIRAFSKGL